MVECKYRGRVIGWLESGVDGFLRYSQNDAIVMVSGGPIISFDGGLTWQSNGATKWTTT